MRRWVKSADRYASLNLEEFLLIALAGTLADYCGRDTVRIHRESHGRADSHAGLDLSRTVGWFTSLYPQRLDCQGDLAASIKWQKEQLRQPGHGGLGYGLLCQQGKLADADHHLDVLFNYLGRFRHDSLPGVSVKEMGLWQAPDAPADAPLTINADQQEGALRLRIDVDGKGVSREQGEVLVAQWLEQCERLACHCEQAPPILTPADMPLASLSQSQLDALPSRPEQILPLSPLQSGLLFHSRLSDRNSTYVNQLILPLTGLSPQRMKQTWQQLLQRHAVLRTALLPDYLAEQRHQAIWPGDQVVLPWQQVDLRPQGDADRYCQQLLEQGFDLEKPPLWRVDLLRTDDETWQCVFTLHHILMDGWSTGVLLTELMALYHGHSPPAAPKEYGVYLRWLQQQDRMRHGRSGRTISPPAGAHSSCGVGRVERERCLPPSSHYLRRGHEPGPASGGSRQGADHQHPGTGSLGQVLGQFTGQRRVVFGNTVAGRPAELAGSDSMLGLFINTLPMTVPLDGDQPVDQWLEALQADNASLREHGHAPLFEVQQEAGWGGESLFDTLLVFENYPLDETLLGGDHSGLQLGTPTSHEFTHYPLTVAVLPGEHLEMLFAHDTGALPVALVDRMATAFRQTLLSLAESQDGPLAELDSLGDDLSRLQTWGEGCGEWGPDSFVSLFAQQASTRGMPLPWCMVTPVSPLPSWTPAPISWPVISSNRVSKPIRWWVSPSSVASP